VIFRMTRQGSQYSRVWSILAVSVFALAGMTFVASAKVSQGSHLREDQLIQLADLVKQRNQRNNLTEQHVAQSRTEVEQLSNRQSSGERIFPMQRQIEKLSGPAGLKPASGLGLIVELDDAPPDAAKWVNPRSPFLDADVFVVHEQDVWGVVNALWAGGASAMQIMDQRVISTSAIRCAGNTLILRGQVYPPPYRITAMGDPVQLRRALLAERRLRIYREIAEVYGLRYEVREQWVDIPGYAGSLDLKYAKALRT